MSIWRVKPVSAFEADMKKSDLKRVLTNNPAPIIAPIPKASSDQAPNVFFSPFSVEAASVNNFVNDFFLKIIDINVNLIMNAKIVIV